MRWNFDQSTGGFIIIYGFLPSFISTLLILLNLLDINKNLILFFISISLTFQLILDYLISNRDNEEKNFFFKVRLPITFILISSIFYLISV